MKKNGFTLAEVLITLGVVGVISAIVMPTFVSRTQTSKIGPKLSKAVAVFEQAAQAVLNDAGSDSLNSAVVDCGSSNDVVTSSHDCFFLNMGHHLKGNQQSAHAFTTNDGVSYTLEGSFSGVTGLYPHQVRILGASPSNSFLEIDINGSTNAPNTPAKDKFYFSIMDDGTLRPFGSSADGGDTVWTAKCPVNSAPTGNDAFYCAAHVLENNLKVEYR